MLFAQDCTVASSKDLLNSQEGSSDAWEPKWYPLKYSSPDICVPMMGEPRARPVTTTVLTGMGKYAALGRFSPSISILDSNVQHVRNYRVGLERPDIGFIVAGSLLWGYGYSDLIPVAKRVNPRGYT